MHFHEVGALDAIVDVVGTCAALEVLGVDEVHSGPVAVGTGTVRAAHGVLPNPAPAVVALLTGAPTYGVDIAEELTTPTGAALLAALADSWGPMPALTVRSVGYGAGHRDLPDRPNVTQVGRRRAGVVTAGARASPSCSSKPTSTTSPARSWPTPSPGCSTAAPTTRGSRRS